MIHEIQTLLDYMKSAYGIGCALQREKEREERRKQRVPPPLLLSTPRLRHAPNVLLASLTRRIAGALAGVIESRI